MTILAVFASLLIFLHGVAAQHRLGAPSFVKTRVTCIGDSITEGGGCGLPTYVDTLRDILGSDYSVVNAGKSSKTMLKKGLSSTEDGMIDGSYWNTDAWVAAQESNPDIVVMMLGTNDAKTFNWEGIQQDTGDYYALDYVEMIQMVQSLKSRPKVYIMVPPPLETPYPFQMNATIINDIYPTLVRNIAAVTGVEVIDIFTAMAGGDKSCDGCHPSLEGIQIIAETVANAIAPKKGARPAARKNPFIESLVRPFVSNKK